MDWLSVYSIWPFNRPRRLPLPVASLWQYDDVVAEPLESPTSESEPNFRRTVSSFSLTPSISIKSHAFHPLGSSELRWKNPKPKRQPRFSPFGLKLKSAVVNLSRKSDHSYFLAEVKGPSPGLARVELGKDFEAKLKIPRFGAFEMRRKRKQQLTSTLTLSRENVGSLKLRREYGRRKVEAEDKPEDLIPFLCVRPLQLTLQPTMQAQRGGVDCEIELKPSGAHTISLTTPAKGVRLVLTNAAVGAAKRAGVQLKLGPPEDGLETVFDYTENGFSVTTSLLSKPGKKGSSYSTQWSGTTTLAPQRSFSFSASSTNCVGATRSACLSTSGIQLSMNGKKENGSYTFELNKNRDERPSVQVKGEFLL